MLLLAAVVIGFAAFGAQRLRSQAADLVTPHLRPPPLPIAPEPFDYRWKLEDLEGAPFVFERLRGQTVLLNFWATWCVPCLSEIPRFEELGKLLEHDEVRILLLTEETPDVIERFLKKRSIGLPVYLIPEGERRREFSRQLPTTVILNRHGQVVLKHVGAADWASEEVAGFIHRIAGE